MATSSQAYWSYLDVAIAHGGSGWPSGLRADGFWVRFYTALARAVALGMHVCLVLMVCDGMVATMRGTAG